MKKVEKRYRLKEDKKSVVNKNFYYGRKGDVVTIISESEMDRLCIVESQANIINNIKERFSIHKDLLEEIIPPKK